MLGHDTADDLFGNDRSASARNRRQGRTFTVIGMLEKRNNAFGGGKNPDDNFAYFPDHHLPQDCIPRCWITGSA